MAAKPNGTESLQVVEKSLSQSGKQTPMDAVEAAKGIMVRHRQISRSR